MSLARDFSALADRPFDLLVLGGGLCNCWVAYDAALRGLRVAIVEKDDWASGECPAPIPLASAALVDIASGRFGAARSALRERRWLARFGRHRVRPLRAVVPVCGRARLGRLRMRVELWAYDRLCGRDHPHGASAWRDCRPLLATLGLAPAGIRGGFVLGDRDLDAWRLALEIVDGAADCGAVAARRARVERLLVESGRVVGALVADLESGRRVEVRAGVTVGSPSPGCDELIAAIAPAWRRTTPSVRTLHLVLPHAPNDLALLWMPSNGDGALLLRRWHGRALLGAAGYGAGDVAELLSRANRALAEPGWRASDVIAVLAGERAAGGVGHELPATGLIVPRGAPAITARVAAANVVDRALRLLGRGGFRAATAARPLPWSPTGRDWTRDAMRSGLRHGLDEETVNSCQARYGTRIEQIFDRVRRSRDLARRVIPDLPFCMAEIVQAAADEAALSLDDVLRRRVPLSLLAALDGPTMREVADRVGAVLGWSGERRRQEIERVLASPAGTTA